MFYNRYQREYDIISSFRKANLLLKETSYGFSMNVEMIFLQPPFSNQKQNHWYLRGIINIFVVLQIFLWQAKILYKSIPFSEDEHENIILTIQSNVYTYLGILLEGRERFEDEILADLKKSQSCVLDTTGKCVLSPSLTLLSREISLNKKDITNMYWYGILDWYSMFIILDIMIHISLYISFLWKVSSVENEMIFISFSWSFY